MAPTYLSPYAWSKKDSSSDFEIRAWCHDKDSNRHLVRLVKAPLWFKVELPPIVGGRPMDWDETTARKFYQFICFILKNDRPINCEFMEAQDLYYYQGNIKRLYLKLTFRNMNSMNHCQRVLAKELNFNTQSAKYGTVKVLVHETDIDPIRKMLTAQNCNFAGWFKIRGTHPVLRDDEDIELPGEFDDTFEKDAMGNRVIHDSPDVYAHISTLPYEREWIVDWRTLEMVPEEEVVGWITQPRVLSFDLECYSNNHRAFPEQWDIECKTFMISTDFQIGDDVNTREGQGIVFGLVADIPDDKVKNVSVIEVTNELDLVYKLADIINHYDPDVITGYNIQDFDIPWLDAKLKLHLKSWPQLGCVLSEPTTMKSWTWESGGYGFNNINMLEIEGRIVIDAYPAVKRGHKLLRYNLDTVAKHFLGKEKCDVSPVEMFLTYERSNETNEAFALALHQCDISEQNASKFHGLIKTRINYVNEQLNVIAARMSTQNAYEEWLSEKNTNDSSKDEPKDIITDIKVESDVVDLDLTNGFAGLMNHDSYNDPSNGPMYDRFGKINWCSNAIWDKFKQISKDILADGESSHELELLPSWCEPMSHKIIADMCAAAYLMTRVMIYCFIDSRLVIELFNKLNIWISAHAMSAVVGVPIVDLFTRGQQVRCLSQLYDLAAKHNVVLSKREAPDIFFNGGFVFNVVPGIFDGVAVIDFNSLYPSIMIAYNLCYTTLLAPEHFHSLDKKDVYTIKVPRPDVKDGNGYDLDQAPTIEGEEDEEGTSTVGVAKTIGSNLSSNYMDNENYYFRFVRPHIRKGLIPTIVGGLIDERKRIRKLQEKYPKSSINWMVYEQWQLALKVSANSMFGFTGAGKQGKRPIIEVAMSITAIGRELIGFVNNYVETKYGADVVYGDSVTRDTPILCRISGDVMYLPIDHLPIIGQPIIVSDKEYLRPYPGLEVWSDQGFTRVKEVIRHITNKNIYLIQTKSGEVKVTEDHSLLNVDGKCVRPKDVQIGDRLLCTFLPDQTLKHIAVPYQSTNVAIRYYHQNKINVMNNVPTDPDWNIVTHIECLGPCGDIVYDLETSNHHFNAGIGSIVVHNTDSSMIDLHIEDKKDYITAGRALAEDVSAQFPPPLKLELEKVMKMILFCKKKYAGYTYTKDGTFAIDDKTGRPILLIRGIILARRDNARWLRVHYEEILRMALDGISLKDAIKYLFTQIEMLFSDKVDHNDLVIVRSIGANYKNPTYFMKMFADNLSRIGKPAKPGDRIGYLIAEARNDAEVKYLGNRMILPETYVEDKDTPNERKIDYMYYLDNLFSKSFDQLFSAGFSKSFDYYEMIQYKTGNMRKPITLASPISLLIKLMKDRRSLLSLKGAMDAVLKSMTAVEKTDYHLIHPIITKYTNPVPPPSPKVKTKIIVVKRKSSTVEKYS